VSTQVVRVVQQPTRVVSIPRAVGSPGAPGEPGTDGQPGAPGPDGAPGASAYDTWLAQGNEGSEADFLASLVGPRGEPGADGTPGQDGAPGSDGEDGTAGSDGREIALRTAAGFVQWQYAGDPGWTNLIALTDLTGPRGDDGTDGTNGADGVDGKSVELRVSGGYIQWRQTDGAWANLVALTAITGPAGADGAPGAPGADGVSPDLTIGTVTTGAPGTPAAASIAGTFPDLHLDLTIPRGADGTGGGSGGSLVPWLKGAWSPTVAYDPGDIVQADDGTGRANWVALAAVDPVSTAFVGATSTTTGDLSPHADTLVGDLLLLAYVAHPGDVPQAPAGWTKLDSNIGDTSRIDVFARIATSLGPVAVAGGALWTMRTYRGVPIPSIVTHGPGGTVGASSGAAVGVWASYFTALTAPAEVVDPLQVTNGTRSLLAGDVKPLKSATAVGAGQWSLVQMPAATTPFVPGTSWVMLGRL